MAHPKVNAAEVVAFRERHGLTQASVDYLFGFSSGGRACRRWEEKGEWEPGAPHYVRILMAYADKYGLATMKEIAADLAEKEKGRP